MNWIISALTEEWADLRKIQEGLSESASLVRVEGATEPVRALIAAALLHSWQGPILIICPTSEAADRMHDHIAALVGDESASGGADHVVLLPSLEALLYEDVTPDPTLVGERLRALMLLQRAGPAEADKPRMFVAGAPAAFQRCLPPQVLMPSAITLMRGEAADREELIARLVEIGYVREQMVEGPGQFSVRGGVLDVFPAGEQDPVRVELFGDEIESLRHFEPNSQRSYEAIESVTILPAREVLLTDEALARAVPEIEDALRDQASHLRAEGRDSEAARLEESMLAMLEALRQRGYRRGVEYLTPFFYPEQTTALDYLPEDALVILDEPQRIAEQYQEFLQDLLELQLARTDQGLLLPLPEALHAPLEDGLRLLARHRKLEVSQFGTPSAGRTGSRIVLPSQPMEEFAADILHLATELRRWQELDNRILIATRQADRLIELLDEAGIGNMVREAADVLPRRGQIVISNRPLNEGFKLPSARLLALTDREVFGWRRVRRPIRRRAAEGIPIGSLTDLREDDYVVHINHGIGIYRGLVRRGPQEGEREYLLIEYAEGDRLYVPTEQFDRVQKYLGGEDERPAVHRLGGSEWARAEVCAGDGGGADSPLRGPPQPPRPCVCAGHPVAAGDGGRLRLRRDTGSARCHPGGQGEHGATAADGPAGLRRCRVRQDRGGDARRLQGGDGWQAGGGARANDGARPAALHHLQGATEPLPGPHRDAEPVPHSPGAGEGCRGHGIGRR
jgi:transcription-repair coupling factor (superfamily II helicase)